AARHRQQLRPAHRRARRPAGLPRRGLGPARLEGHAPGGGPRREPPAGAGARLHGSRGPAEGARARGPSTRTKAMTRQPHACTRRELLVGSGALFAWDYAPKLARAEGRDPRLLTVVLRGALDGLAAVAPAGDANWVSLRGDKALLLSGQTP